MHRSLPLALAACFALLACSSSAPSADDPRQDSESYIAARDGKLLHYRKRGVGTNVLLIPGGSWMAEDLEPLTENRMVISYDMRGRGRSDPVAAKTPPTLEQDLEDLESVVNWFGLKSFALLGMDYNAAVCALYAAEHPEQVERIVLVSPLPVRKDPYYEIYDRVFTGRLDSRDFAELRNLARLLVPRREPARWAREYKKAIFTGWVADPESLEDMNSNPFVDPNIDPERIIRQYGSLLEALGNWDFRAELAEVDCAALVVYGSADPVPEESSLEWSSTLPAGAPHRIEGSGRMPWFEQPDGFFPLVESFLDAGR